MSIDDLEQAFVVLLDQMNRECKKQADFCCSSTNRCLSCPYQKCGTSVERTGVLAGSCQWQSKLIAHMLCWDWSALVQTHQIVYSAGTADTDWNSRHWLRCGCALIATGFCTSGSWLTQAVTSHWRSCNVCLFVHLLISSLQVTRCWKTGTWEKT